jgi:hypothetical protein
MGEGDFLVKIMGIADVIAAILLAVADVPVIGKLKWILVAILLAKGIPSLLS